MKKEDLKIGVKLYQFSSKILEYELIEIQQLKTKDHTETFYILGCLSCNDHSSCNVATRLTKKGLEYSHMTNNEDQEYWHKNKEYNWFLDKSSARIFVCDYYIAWNNKQITNNLDKIKNEEEAIRDLKEKKQAILDERTATLIK